MIKAYLRERLYVPASFVEENVSLLDFFTYCIDDTACQRCTNKHEDSSACLECPLYETREIRTYSRNKGYMAFCRGNLGKIYKIFKDLQIVDQTTNASFKYDLKFTSKLWDNQIITTNKWLKYKYGILQSSPRSGKTCMSSFITCSLRQKTLVLTHQQDLLDQFLTTFQNHTNLKELQEKYNTDKIVGITNCREDLSDYDVCLSTYQSFITDKGKNFLGGIQNTFGLVIVDEVHTAAANCFRTVTNSINARYRLGLSATPKRKDSMECLVYDIMGPVTSAGESNEMHCKVVIINTGVQVSPFRQWTTFIKRLSENEERNEQICNMAKKDVDDGRYVLIVTERIKHIDLLAQQLTASGLTVATYDGRVPKLGRKKLLDSIRDGKYEVVIAMRKMIKLGIDIPLLDCYYHVIPMAYDKNYYQEMSRIRTPYPKELECKLGKKKQTPLIRVFLDRGHGAVFACFKIIDKVHIEQNFEVVYTESVYTKKKNQW
jgi:superfamily II DNA or RNA helicase